MIDICSLPKRQQSMHIHICRRKELAHKLERTPSKLKYCYECFDWFVEEDWGEHCRMHLQSLSSKRCSSITYCNVLLRPSFCPFCLGDDRLQPSFQWQSFTKDAKLWSHLGAHIVACRWPLKCPHPLCSLQFDDELSFLYYLGDVHSVYMSVSTQESWRNRRDCDTLTWASGTESQNGKRKRHTVDGEGTMPSTPIAFDNTVDSSYLECFSDRKATNASPTPLWPEKPEVPFVDLTADNDPVPGLTYDESLSSPDSNETRSLDGLSQQGKPISDSDEALFSAFLRSPSPPTSDIIADHSKDGRQTSIPPPTISPVDVCLPKSDPYLADPATERALSVENEIFLIKRPYMKLYVRPANTASKPKVSLRFNPPKKTLQPKSSRRRGIKNLGSKRC